jgi:hypothetical protein
MTPKEKALELVEKFRLKVLDYDGNGINGFKAKQCALLAVDEMIDEYQSMSDLDSILFINNEHINVINKLVYWQEVKQELRNV